MTSTPTVRVRRDSGLYGYERALSRVGLAPVAGADEAGRGACAGPSGGRRGDPGGLEVAADQPAP